MSPLRVSYKVPAQLRPLDSNPRTHTPKQIKQIAASIKEFGFINPVLIDGSGGIIAGHCRVEAARLLGMADIPTVCAGHLTPDRLGKSAIVDLGTSFRLNPGLRIGDALPDLYNWEPESLQDLLYAGIEFFRSGINA